nr:hypothetical protein [Tanacetum cinerariifolium]
LRNAVRINKMVRHALPFLKCWLSGADAELAEKLARVGRQNFGAELPGQSYAQGRFAHGGGAGQGQQHGARVGGGGR